MKSKMKFNDALKSGLLAGIASILINVILFFVFKALGFFTDDILVNGTPLTVLPIIMASFVPALIGSMVFFLLNKYLNVSFNTFAIISLVLLTLSMINPFAMIPNVTIAFAVGLDILHIPVALFLLYFLQKASK
jgi:hypothetical protein